MYDCYKNAPTQAYNFSGDPLDWPLWKATFETVIEKRTLNDHEKVLYLLQYLSGKPRKVIEGYHFMQSPNAFEEAKKKLLRNDLDTPLLLLMHFETS